MKAINLYHASFKDIFVRLKANVPHSVYDYKKHVVQLLNENFDPVGFLRLPLHVSVSESLEVLTDDNTVIYLSIESGYAAICIMKGRQNIYHTTFSAYMSRKKQGFSQIKYLKKKGKSRAGSRVRLAATTEFFENINTSLVELFEDHTFARIALNCTSTLIPYLFNTKVACPFDKKEEKLYKIPLHIPLSNYTNLDAAIKKLMAPVLFYEEKHEEFFHEFIQNL